MNIIDGLDNTPEGELLKSVFGLRSPTHNYLRCGNCGAEYFRSRPTYCTCGYAGGVIECVQLREIQQIMRKELKGEYSAAVDPYRKMLAGETDIVAAMRGHVKRMDERFRECPRTLALLLCAFQELTA